ncbi:MAG: thioredoxin family protein [Verrucomicrobiae bacterium]|nr:thioredoxin family protein [Verrucomicrobiae bacterium]
MRFKAIVCLLCVSAAIFSWAETYRCQTRTPAYDPSDHARQIGFFEIGSDLEIQGAVDAHGMVPVAFNQPNGQKITALCPAASVGKGTGAQPAESAEKGKPGATVSTDTSRWMTDYDKALAIAKAEKKFLLMDFSGSDWCGWCVRLEEEVFSKGAFKAYAKKNLVLLLVDFPKTKPLPADLRKQNESLAAKHGIEGFPTVVILNSDGEKAGQTGYVKGGPSAFIRELDSIIGKGK